MQAIGGRLLHRELTDRILSCAIEVHRTLGPGLLESAYRICLLRELELQGVSAVPEVPIPLRYKGMAVESAYRADLIVDYKVLVELKSTDKLLPIHDAQLLTYLRLCDLRVGLLLNFNVTSLRQGMRRLICCRPLRDAPWISVDLRGPRLNHLPLNKGFCLARNAWYPIWKSSVPKQANPS